MGEGSAGERLFDGFPDSLRRYQVAFRRWAAPSVTQSERAHSPGDDESRRPD